MASSASVGSIAKALDIWSESSAFTDLPQDSIRATLFELKNILENLKSANVRLLKGLRRLPHPCSIPIPKCCGQFPLFAQVSNDAAGSSALPLQHRDPTASTLQFIAPTSVDVVGSFMLDCMSMVGRHIDVCVTMPQQSCDDSHRKNFGIHDKTQLYLRHLASSLLAQGFAADVAVGFTGCDVTASHLRLSPAAWRGEGAPAQLHKAHIHLHAAADIMLLKVHRLHPKFNNVVRWVYRRSPPQPSTAAYNSQLVMASTRKAPLKAIHATLKQAPGARSAVLILKSWAAVRGLSACVGGWSGFALSALVAALVQSGVVKPNMNACQAVRALMLHIAHGSLPGAVLRLVHPWSPHDDAGSDTGSDDGHDEEEDTAFEGSEDEDSDGASSADGSDSEGESEEDGGAPVDVGAGAAALQLQVPAAAPTDEEWAAHFECTVVCPTAWANLLHMVTPHSLDALRREACLSLPAFGLATDQAAREALVDDPSALTALAHGNADRMTGAIAAPALTVARRPAVESLAVLQGSRCSALDEFDRVIPVKLPACPVQFPLVGAAHTQAPSSKKRRKGAPTVPAVAALPEGPELKAALLAAGDKLEAAGITAQQGDMLCAGPWWLGNVHRATALLRQGLGDRVHEVRVLPVWHTVQGNGAEDPDLAAASSKTAMQATRLPDAWGLQEAAPTPSGLLLCLQLRPRSANRVVDKGPSPSDHPEEAAAFDAFWGDKAQSRRFADGTILQAVLWERPGGLRTCVVDAVAQHIVSRHLGLAPVHPEALSPQAVLDALAQPDFVHQSAGSSTVEPWQASGEAAAAAVVSACEVVSRALQKTPGMPLRVMGVDTASHQARASGYAVLQPHSAACAAGDASTSGQACVVAQPVDCVVTLESSGKWPKDLSAVAASKCAFLLKMRYGLPKVLGSGGAVQVRVPAALRALFADAAPAAAAMVGETPESIAESLHSAAGHDASLVIDDADISAWCPALIVMFGGYVFRLWLWLPQELAGWTALTRQPATQVFGSTALLAPYGGIFATEATMASGFVNIGLVGGASKEAAPAPVRRADLQAGMAHLRPAARAFVDIQPQQAVQRATALYRRFVLAPRHAKAVTAFGGVYPAYAGATRLAAQWLAAQGMLGSHVTYEALEMTMAHVFMDPRPLGVPASAFAALLRWLQWLSTWDFSSSALLVDWEGDAKATDEVALQHRAAVRRSSEGEGAPAWYIVTMWDKGLWTPQWSDPRAVAGPCHMVAAKLRHEAGVAAGLLRGMAAQHCMLVQAPAGLLALGGAKRPRTSHSEEAPPSAVQWRRLFESAPVGSMDIVLKLHSSAAVSADGVAAAAYTETAFKNTLPALRKRMLLQWSPAQHLVATIHRSNLGKFVFAFPAADGCKVGLVLRPEAFPAPGRAALRKLAQGTAKPSHGKTAGIVQQLLSKVYALGGSSIKSVTVHTK